jgi:hypothetical protein
MMTRPNPHPLTGGAGMTRRLAATALTLGVAVATVTSVLALGESAAGQQPAPPPSATVVKEEARPDPPAAKAPGGTTKVMAEMKVFKATPAPKTAADVKRQAVPFPAPAAAMKVAMPVAAFNVDGQAQQYLQQFRPILRAEYHIVRVVCRPTPEQRKEIACDAEQTLREVARKYVEMMRRPMTATQRAALDPRGQIREGLAKAVKARLSGEMAARYQEEIAKRAASHKQLAVRNLVARLDRDLVLSPDQRDKVAKSLTSHWDDSWCTSIEMFMYDNQYLPPIPDQHVAPFLNDAQKTIWRGIQKVQVSWGGFGMMGGIMVDDPLEDEELRLARQEASKNDPKPGPNRPEIMMQREVMINVRPPAPPAEANVQTKTFTKKGQTTAKDQKKTTEPVKEEAVPKR